MNPNGPSHLRTFVVTFLFILVSLVGSDQTKAAQVPESIARTVAQRFMESRVIGLRSEQLQLVVSKVEQGSTLYRIYNVADQGFIVVSGDDAALPILAYSTESIFPAGDLPEQVAKWFEGYTQELRATIQQGTISAPQVTAQWARVLTDDLQFNVAERAVNPLVQTNWGQAPNVNAQCPGGSVTGCVATAMAQIMKYHNHPVTGAGFHSYNAPNYGTLSANFGSTTYNWAGMPNTVNSANSAVATLMYHCGVSVDMEYSPQTSNAYMITSGSPIQACSEYAMKTYFGYSTAMHGEKRENYTEQQWTTMLRAELDASRPILYAGMGNGGGHCFVADGYNDNNFFHFNWGWAGQADGYFQVGALNPGSTGTGGGSGGYNSGQQALVGITPATGGGGGQTGGPTTMALSTFVTPSGSPLYYANPFSVTTNIVNNGTNGFSGDYAAAAFDNANNFYGFIETLSGYTLPAGNTYSNNLTFSTTGLYSMVPGTYYIGIFFRPTGGEWVLVSNSGGYTNLPQVNVINPSDIEVASAMTVSPGNTLTQGGQVSVNLNVQNDGFNTFMGQYGVAMYNLDGSWAQDIGLVTENQGLPSGYSYLAPYLTFGPAAITVGPGTYLIAAQHNPSNTGWYLTGSSYFSNPVFVTVTAAAEQPDQYEANNAVAQAATLTANFSGNNAYVNTTGSNLHTGEDQDFYKVILPSGNNYSINSRAHDAYNSGNGNTYTVDCLWSYSTDGSTWSAAFDDVASGSFTLNGGGTVYFHVAPYFAGQLGTYLLQMDIQRGPTVGVEESIATAGIKVFPNPTQNNLFIELSDFNGSLEQAELVNLSGQVVAQPKLNSVTGTRVTLDLSTYAEGAYLLRLITDKGVRNERIIVAR